VVGLHPDPPENAIALCVDEKTQVRALDRTQPMLPMRPDQIERYAHQDKRHGTAPPHTALEVHACQAVHRTEDRHHSRELIAFMNQLLRTYPKTELHVILDNVITHRSEEVQEWHSKPKHDRVISQFIPTRSSWLSLLEVLSNLVQAEALRRERFPAKQTLVKKLLSTSSSSTRRERSSSRPNPPKPSSVH